MRLIKPVFRTRMPAQRLTPEQRRRFERAERRIAAGLKSFLDVGLALREIKKRRLYCEHYDSFEDYVFERWGLSRPRAYELCAASEVVSSLSAIADTNVLPENEAQARPLGRLKSVKLRKRAWLTALDIASRQKRVVTAKDVEAAVARMGKEPSLPVDGVPKLDAHTGIRAAYADPPYVGQANKHYRCPEVDHEQLIERLETFDAWALSLSSTTLPEILPLCPAGVRIGAWVKPFAVFKPGVNPAYSWEPVIFKLGRERTRQQPTIRDWVSENVTLKRGLVAAKPDGFCFWLFEMLNLQPGDEFHDLFEGSCAVSMAFRRWVAVQARSDGARNVSTAKLRKRTDAAAIAPMPDRHTTARHAA
jgi:hypothetical protein